MEDTISAIATALGLGAVGIIRISGPQAVDIGCRAFRAVGSKKLGVQEDHRLLYGHIVDNAGQVIDEVLTVYMAAPHSYTGEDVVEIQCHGGLQAMEEILKLTYQLGARAAEPGEFTKRAFLNGRVDLAQAEAVMGVIEARSKQALQGALAQQRGALSRAISVMRTQLKDLVVRLEATIDYPEEDIEEVTYNSACEVIAQSLQRVEQLLATAHTGKIVREGLRTVLVGRPNVGKSSLLNRLLQEERAIVSSIPGTTRDVIQEQILIDGIPLLLADTAGIRTTGDHIEQIGVARSRETMEQAQLVVAVLDGSMTLQDEDLEILRALKGRESVVVVNKGDLHLQVDLQALKAEFGENRVLVLSAKTAAGIETFIQWLKTYVYAQGSAAEGGVLVQNARHAHLLQDAKISLDDALLAAHNHLPYDCIEIDLRGALDQLGAITGETVSEEIINDIFARFCLGK